MASALLGFDFTVAPSTAVAERQICRRAPAGPQALLEAVQRLPVLGPGSLAASASCKSGIFNNTEMISSDRPF